jgi:hypothetical protein
MSEKYFSKFPLITYNNQLAVNITERVVVRDFPSAQAFLYYPYDIQNFERPDQLADRYLNDEFMSWILYMSNGVTDPYYDWIISDDAFNDYLRIKYGNIDTIIQKVMYYRNNWYNDTTQITVGQFNSLPDIVTYDPFGNMHLSSAKKYYDRVLVGSDTESYKRKQVDDIIATNKIVQYTITGTSNFVNNEIVSVRFGYVSESSSATGQGQVLASNSSSITIQHTSGYVDEVPSGHTISYSNSYVYGTESTSNCLITALSSVANNISNTEAIYWSPVTIFEDEYEKNLKNKTIRLINPGVAQDISQKASDTLASLL